MIGGVRLWPFGLVRVGNIRDVFDGKGRIGGVCIWRYRLKRWDAVLFKRGSLSTLVHKDV